MRLPLTIPEGTGTPVADLGNLHPSLASALAKGGFQRLFPVQATVWQLSAGGASTQHDICICSPTGSGKTLAYALPIIQGLSRRLVPRLCALVVLPTRDLAQQVFSEVAGLAPSVGLRVALMAGRAAVPEEAAAALGKGLLWPPADIVVATPGRLMAHLAGTRGFNLLHLRYLVVDEADRLLRQAYQDWLPHVLAATQHNNPRLVKMVVSATLTKDPSKVQNLALHWPRFLAVQAPDSRYQVPSGLEERWVTCRAVDKPAVLLALLHLVAGQRTIVFGNSLESTHRLYTFLQAVPGLGSKVGEYSSAVSDGKRSELLPRFRAGSVTVLVASDAMTHGMDVPDVENIINYEPPAYVKTYVHRAGRTARAGKTGCVYTLVRAEELRHFRALLQKIDGSTPSSLELDKEVLKSQKSIAAEAITLAQGLDSPQEN